MEKLRKDADSIVRAGIETVMPDEAVRRALKEMPEARGGLIITGPTGTNVNDAAVALISK